jgi:2,4-dienoyl-CoA reductase-like NADH-dependent reductase (Old Yellow Enzyme family)
MTALENNNINNTYAIYGECLKYTVFAPSPDSYIPYSEDLSVLKTAKKIGDKIVRNRIAYQPMEGQDADKNGNPTEITIGRYKALGDSGAGLIWFEAVAVVREGKSNPYQLMLTDENLDSFKALVEVIKESCMKKNSYEPVVIMQMTHSGRYSKPDGKPEPIVAYRNSDIDKADKELNIASDGYLSSLTDKYVKSAVLADKAGFDGVDVKCCHGYLLEELLSAFDREGIYGGSFENRSRLLTDTVAAVSDVLPGKSIKAVRLNLYDGYSSCENYGGKYSFCESKGKNENKNEMFDLSEAHKLVAILEEKGVSLLNATMGSPYRNPDVSRPYRKGIDMPKSDALYALTRLFKGAEEIHKNHDLACVNTGISLLGRLSPYAAAGLIKENMTDFVGFGRMSFAYPALARDILNGSFNEKLACVACSGCSTLKKNQLKSGCIIRNEFYKNIYKDFTKGGVS